MKAATTRRRGGWLQSRPFLFTLVFWVSVATLPVAEAHRGHGCWTDLDYVNDRFEITHRLHLADAIAVLRRIDPETNIDSLRGKAQLALYVEERFQVVSDGTAVTSINTLGAEIEDDFLLVYQEWATEQPASVPTFHNRALQDIAHGAQYFIRYTTDGVTDTFQLESSR